MAIWLHPSVTSTIVDNSGFYATADGVTTAFFPGFFQKGKDNELIAVDGPTDADLVKKFGKIDAVEYGQNHLNLVNWLVAGGSAIVMRCLPDNAKYAHAILEVLTKSVSVKANFFTPDDTKAYGDGPYEVQRDYDVDGVFTGLFYVNADGEKVALCDAKYADMILIDGVEENDSVANYLNVAGEIVLESVNKTEVVPKITYVPSGVSKKETIEAYIMNKHGQLNGDGYTRHILGYFIPEGRGASFYNDVRISISLTTNYDNSYDFRVYSLHFEAYDAENEEWGIIYGPFYVSFDETSRDFSDETMFIADILDKYCEEFSFVPYGANADEESGLYNAGFYSAAKAIAGSEVSPRRVDVLSGQEYFNEAEESFSNIHKDVLLNGGTYILRRDVISDIDSDGNLLGSPVLYIDGKNLPIPGAVAIINNDEYKISSVDTTRGSITLTENIPAKINVDEEYAKEVEKIDDDDNKAAAKKICLFKDDVVIYINDIAEPKCEASVKNNDKAIERVTGKEYKLYLNKNGADFYKGQSVVVTLSDITEKGDDPTTYPILDITGEFTASLKSKHYNGSVFMRNEDNADKYSVVAKPFGKLKIYQNSVHGASTKAATIGECFFGILASETTEAVQKIGFTHTESDEVDKITITSVSDVNGIAVNDVFTYDGQFSSEKMKFYNRTDSRAFIIADSSSDDGIVLKLYTVDEVYTSIEDMTSYEVNQTFNCTNEDETKNITVEYVANNEPSHSIYLAKKSIPAVISDVIDIDDAIIVAFAPNELDDEDAKAIVSKFDKFDSAGNLKDGVANELSDNYSAKIVVTAEALPVSPYSKYLSLSENDYAYMQFGSAGDSDTVDGASRADVAKARKSLLVKAFRGTLNPAITMKKFWPFDIVLDANYDASVKNAINELTTSREDFMFLCDTGFCATPEQAIDKRNGSLTYNNRYTAIFTQDMRVYDEYTGKNLKVTPTYFLAKKIPYVDRAFGIHYAFVGPQRGEIEGMLEGTLSWNPTEQQKEKLYKKQLNYIQHDPNHLMFMGQLTSQKRATSLSDIPNVRALLKIRREIENICEEYYFERINENLLGAMSSACNNYLGNWVANGTLSEGNVSVYASEYDMKQKLVRVQVELKFTSFLERVVITFTVK